MSGSASITDGLYTASAEGAVIELPSRARLRVGPNGTLRVFPLPQLLALTPGARTWTWSFALQSGRVDVELPRVGRNAVLASIDASGATGPGHTLVIASLSPDGVSSGCDRIDVLGWRHDLDSGSGALQRHLSVLWSFGVRQSGNMAVDCAAGN